MANKNVSRTRLFPRIALYLLLLVYPAVAGCDFDPSRYFAKNACDFLNCRVLFFLEDLFPLSAGPITGGGGGGEAPAEGGGGEAPADPEDDGGGHVH